MSPLPAFGTLCPVQVAYHVPDPEAAARRAASEYGWGPFFLMTHIPLSRSLYRGREAVFDHSSAYGQAGDIMIEFITQHNDGPSALRDMYAPGETGIHHVACFVEDLSATLGELAGRGLAIALEARTVTGVDFAMVDTSASLGHMLELYQHEGSLEKFYSYVRHKARDWDGSEPVRLLKS